MVHLMLHDNIIPTYRPLISSVYVCDNLNYLIEPKNTNKMLRKSLE